MSVGEVHDGSVTQTTVAAQYETLRMAAVGEALPPEARSGLTLFLRRGMWGWARALAAAPAQPVRTPPSGSTPLPQSGAVIQLFAAMAMGTSRSVQ